MQLGALYALSKLKSTMNLVQTLRKIGIAEGVSFLILLLIAMPLKYFYGMPLAVKYVGWAHGLLFVLYIGWAYYVKISLSQSLLPFVYACLAALIPCGTFIYDRQLKKIVQ
jgi:integral membrane protein